MVEKIEKLLKEKKIPKKVFLKDLGLGINALSDWRKRGNVPSGEVLLSIAEYLGVSVGYLLGTEEKAPQTVELTEDDEMILSLFRSLSEDQKESLLTLMRSLREKQNEK